MFPQSLRAKKSISQPMVNFVRGKRTKSKGSLSPVAQRVVTQLSVMSASRKQPKLLKLSREDLIKHQMIQKCWSMHQEQLRTKRNDQLRNQYKSAHNAMDLLKQIDSELYAAANESEAGKRFPTELRIPTNYPPKKIWYYEYKKKE
ncbi:LAFE_0F13674g1_1 [Lachancea fermentati]|uniref:Large ribosomal subunit protein mL40 n=1 Tax=Lachancea fermentati TaxID=4955 RepID=A0A1G4MFZ9_LACFM|nr:LAFE_0F13674g1_1 [Lachancea fermentati]